MATIVDVAREAGVSTAAVSLVVNDPKTSRVGQDKKKRILRVARKLGYTPNSLAKALIQRSTRILGLVVPMRDPIFFNHFVAHVLAGIQSCLIEREYHLMVYSHSARSGKITRSQILQSKFVDGLIFFNTRLCTESDMSATIHELTSAGTPFVMVNAYYGHDAVNYVGVDDAQIGYLGGCYLIRKGHRRIAWLGGSRRSPVSERLDQGFRKALHENGIEQDLFAFGEYHRQTVQKVTLDWLRHQRPPSAIFCTDDQMAPDVYDALREQQLRIPQDIAVLGRGDLTFASYLSPKLTSIRIPTAEMGRRAAELALESIAGRDRIPQRILLPTEVVERESV